MIGINVIMIDINVSLNLSIIWNINEKFKQHIKKMTTQTSYFKVLKF